MESRFWPGVKSFLFEGDCEFGPGAVDCSHLAPLVVSSLHVLNPAVVVPGLRAGTGCSLLYVSQHV